MQLKNLSLLAGAIALSLTATHEAVKAQTSSPGQLLVAQAEQKPPLSLQLTPQQQEKIKQIRSESNTQFQRVLTQQQREQLKAALQAGQTPQQAFAALKFTPQQQNQLEQLVQSQRKQMEAVLTAEQRQEIQRYQQENVRSRPQQPQQQKQ